MGLVILMILLSPVARYFLNIVKSRCYPVMFSYKHVLITGAGSGLGREIALEMFKRGAYITMVGKNEKELSETLEMINEIIVKTGKKVTNPLAQIFAADIGEIKS
jgi:NAD(P)-dependent dehydrogenase (short-subunit alcohol dehydrogenase family)